MKRDYDELRASLAEVLDIDAGLRDVLIQARHTELVSGLAAVLDVDRGLNAILPTPKPPADVPDAYEGSSAATPLRIWARDLTTRHALDRLVLRAKLPPSQWHRVFWLTQVSAIATRLILILNAGAHPESIGKITKLLASLAAKTADDGLRTVTADLSSRAEVGNLTRRIARTSARAVESKAMTQWQAMFADLLRASLAVDSELSRALKPLVQARRWTTSQVLVEELLYTVRLILNALNDFTGADLRGANMDRLSPAGIRWSDSTLWPPELAEEIRLASDEVEPGIYVVRGGTSNVVL